MKHHCHCGLKQHFQVFKMKKLGLFGAILMILHVLFHVVECLFLPAIILTFSNQPDGSTTDEDNQATQIGCATDQDLELFRPQFSNLHNITISDLKEYKNLTLQERLGCLDLYTPTTFSESTQ